MIASWFRRLRSLLTIALVLGGGVAFLVLVGGRPASQPAATAAASNAPATLAPVAVTVEPVAFRTLQQSVEAVGTLNGYEHVTVAAKVDGQIQKVFHDVADRVRPGEPLLEIETVNYDLALHRAEKALEADLSKLGLQNVDESVDVEKIPAVVQAHARLNNLRTQLDRDEALATQRAIATEQLDNARAEFKVGAAEYANQLQLIRALLVGLQDRKLAVAEARQKFSDATVRAPVPSQPVPDVGDKLSYAIVERRVAEGTYVRAGTEVFRLVIDRPLKLLATVPERYVSDVRPGQPVVVHAGANSHPFTGAVTRINPEVNSSTRTFEVEILVPNTQGELKPGGFARVEIQTRENPHVATVPLESLVSFAGVTKIFLVEHGQARAVPVELGLQTADWVEVLSPALPEGATVVTSGQSAVVDGSAVAVRSMDTAANVARRETR